MERAADVSDMIPVTLVVPAQKRVVYYDREEWEFAVENGEVWDMAENDLSNFDPEMEIHGPEGEIFI